MLTLFTQVYLKFFFLFTPFFVITTFLALTREHGERERRAVALKVTGAVVVIAFGLYLFGKHLFDVFGITLDAFRIGAGGLLFLSAVSLVQGGQGGQGPGARQEASRQDDIAVVPLALPVIVGPATTGALLVMAAETTTPADIAASCAALLAAVLSVGGLLYVSGTIERIVGARGLVILSKLTGLILASIAAQLVFTGVRNFLH
jgi:multiple antibiotic resistance protein